jgi:hypothetical protein
MALDPNVLAPSRIAADPATAYAAISFGWKELLDWLGVSAAVPEIQGQIAAWRAFQKEREQNSPGLSWLVPGYGPYQAWKAWQSTNGISSNDGLQGQAHDLAVAQSLAAAHGYKLPVLDIDAAGKVTRADVGQPTGANSPGPTAQRPNDPTVVKALVTPSNEVLHPTATAIDDARKKLTPPAPENLGLKVAALSAVALGTIVGTLAARNESTRVAVAGGGTLGALALAYAFFSSSAPAPDPKMAGAGPLIERHHRHVCHNCGNVWEHDAGPCMGGTPAACTIAHVCEQCGRIERLAQEPTP